MAVAAKCYQHPSDEKALEVLKAVPGFALLTRPFIRFFQERPAELIMMGNFIRVSDKQYPGLYHLLLPICAKLGIKVPALYVELDPNPNAYTIGDQNPIVVVTTGLLEILPLNDVSTTLAHECGHIACHHVLYQTIARSLSGMFDLVGVPFPVSMGIRVAMQYWVRCSELSADRAAAVCTGGADKVIRLMMQLAGGAKNIYGNFSVDEYLKQAEQYQKDAKKSAWSRIVNFFAVADESHPFTATRVLEINKWCSSQQFQNLLVAA